MLKETINKFKQNTLGSASKTSEVSTQTSTINELTKIVGILTSTIRPKPSSDTPYYGYLRTRADKHSLEECAQNNCKDCENPVIFKIKDPECNSSHHLFANMFCWLKPKLSKGDKVRLEGKFETTIKSKKSSRLSFTCYSYQILAGDIKNHGK